MWAWFAAHGVWIFIISALGLTIFLFYREKFLRKLIGSSPEEKRERITKRANVIFWAIEGAFFLVVIAALIAIVLSTEGIAAKITTEQIEGWILAHGTAILMTVLVGLGLWYVWRKAVPVILSRFMAQPKRGESKEGTKRRADTLKGILLGTGRVVILSMVFFTVLSELSVPIGPILAGFGIVGIAVGFGAQYLIRDLIAGIFILFENQYRVGDVARVADVAGLVEEITLRKTVLRDLDGIVHHVPNGDIKVASNFSRHFARVNLDVSVAYDTDLEYAISVINRVCKELAEDPAWNDKLRTMPQVLRVNNLGDSGIDIKVLGETKPLEQWAVTGELRLRIKKAFDAEGIEIPWPHTKVYFGNAPWEKGAEKKR